MVDFALGFGVWIACLFVALVAIGAAFAAKAEPRRGYQPSGPDARGAPPRGGSSVMRRQSPDV